MGDEYTVFIRKRPKNSWLCAHRMDPCLLNRKNVFFYIIRSSVPHNTLADVGFIKKHWTNTLYFSSLYVLSVVPCCHGLSLGNTWHSHYINRCRKSGPKCKSLIRSSTISYFGALQNLLVIKWMCIHGCCIWCYYTWRYRCHIHFHRWRKSKSYSRFKTLLLGAFLAMRKSFNHSGLSWKWWSNHRNCNKYCTMDCNNSSYCGIERAFKSTLQLGNGKNVTVSCILLPFKYSEWLK